MKRYSTSLRVQGIQIQVALDWTNIFQLLNWQNLTSDQI